MGFFTQPTEREKERLLAMVDVRMKKINSMIMKMVGAPQSKGKGQKGKVMVSFFYF